MTVTGLSFCRLSLHLYPVHHALNQLSQKRVLTIESRLDMSAWEQHQKHTQGMNTFCGHACSHEVALAATVSGLLLQLLL